MECGNTKLDPLPFVTFGEANLKVRCRKNDKISINLNHLYFFVTFPSFSGLYMKYPNLKRIFIYLIMVDDKMNSEQDIQTLFTSCMTRRRFTALIGVCTLSACSSFIRSASQGPALWVARSDTARVYLFGQMPVRTETDWLTPDIEAAFEGSDVIWLENPDISLQSPETMEAINALNKQLTPPDDYTVLSVLNNEYRQRLLQILKREGLDPISLKGHNLMYTRQLLTSIKDRKSHADFKSIPEVIFRKRAKIEGKPILTEWRDFLELFKWGTDRPDVQKELVLMAIDEIDSDYQAELDSWLSGKLDVQTGLVLSRSKRYPELTRHINSIRNEEMAKRIQKSMKKYKQQFVCMGISHMVGPDSVPSFLKQSGLDVSRV